MINEFIKIFEGYGWAHGIFKKDKSNLPGKVEGVSIVKREEVTKVMWENHLNGLEPSLGIMPVTEKSECKWGCIDVDKFDLDYEEILKKIRKLSLPLIMIRSKSGCAHLFLFVKKFVPAEEVQFVLKKFAAQLGIADKLDRIYPMQTKFIKGGTGSWLNMPYFNHEEGTRYAYKDNFDAASLSEFFEMYEKYAQDDLKQYLTDEQEVEEKVVKNKKIKKPAYLPCIQNCMKDNNGKIPDGMRNEFGFQAAWFFKKAHEEISKFEGTIRTPHSLLSDFNTQKISPPLEGKTINKLTDQLANNDYNPKCKVKCIKKYCDLPACKKNIFGITPDFAKELYAAEDILGMIYEYGSVPPKYYMYVKVKGIKDTLKDVRVEFKGSELKDKKAFLTKLHNFGHFPPKALEMMKATDFSDFIDARLSVRTYEEASEEAHHDFDFVSIIRTFLVKATVSIDKKDLLDGACYYDQKKKVVHLRLGRLQQYLQATRQSMSTAELTFKLKHILKAKKCNGKVLVLGGEKEEVKEEKSCPTWMYPEDPENFVLTLEGKEQLKEIENEKD
tara:strand:+ start:670 stop:2337 length:1668 start_codon:yes stop_codon:yes gene_type:complete